MDSFGKCCEMERVGALVVRKTGDGQGLTRTSHSGSY